MSVSKSFLKASLPLAIALQTGSALAGDPIQSTSGWSGDVFAGAGTIELRNNEVAGNKLVDLRDKYIDDLGDASSQSAGTGVVNFKLRYTLTNKKTEVFAGTDEADSLRMDNTTGIGIRHAMQGKGIVGVRALIGSSIAATQVYNDPFNTSRRKKTDRETMGGDVKWENIMDSNFDVDMRMRKINVVNDRNGDYLVDVVGSITAGEGNDLDRDGNLTNLEVKYTYAINKTNIIVPFAMYTDNDRHGKARDFPQGDVGMEYLYNNDNPVVDDKQDTNFWSDSSKVSYAKPYGMKNWDLSGDALMSVCNSDISFYNTRIFVAYVGAGYKF